MHGASLATDIQGSFDFKVGAGAAVALNNTFSYTRGRESKLVRGTYRRTTKGDALLDSMKTAYVCGGEHDKTMMTSNDDELVLSYDDSSRGRAGMFDAADAWAKTVAIAGAATMAVTGSTGVTWYKGDVSERAPERDKDAKTVEMDMELERVSGVSEGDVLSAVSAVGGLAFAVAASRGEDTPNPKHKSPSARVVLRNELVKLFAGTKEETEVLLKSDGLMMFSERSVVLQSEKADVKIAAQKEVAIKASAVISLDGMVKHRNLVISR